MCVSEIFEIMNFLGFEEEGGSKRMNRCVTPLHFCQSAIQINCIPLLILLYTLHCVAGVEETIELRKECEEKVVLKVSLTRS